MKMNKDELIENALKQINSDIDWETERVSRINKYIETTKKEFLIVSDKLYVETLISREIKMIKSNEKVKSLKRQFELIKNL